MKKRIISILMLMAMCFSLAACSFNSSQAPEIGYFLVSDFEGKAVGILENSGLEESIKDRVPGAKIKKYKSAEDAVSALKAYSVQALFLDASNASVAMSKDDTIGKVYEPYIESGLVIASKALDNTANGEFRIVIDAALTRLRDNGGLIALLEKYITNPYPTDVDIEFNQTKIDRELNVGVLADNIPFSYKTESGDWAGFDIEVANEIAKSFGATPVFKEYSKDQMIEAMENDEIRIAFAEFTTKDGEAWKGQISDAPYFDTSIYIIANKADVGIVPIQ